MTGADRTLPLQEAIGRCRACANRFSQTRTAHTPRPVAWFRRGTPILIAGQAPGARVHASGIPFDDRSGDRLRQWLGMDRAAFYDRALVSILPTSFCFPGYSASGSDLPPPPLCWETWHRDCMAEIGEVRLRVLVGGYAIRRHLGARGSVQEVVEAWRSFAPGTFPLPHPSWRNTAWLRRNPWFEKELLPDLRAAVARALGVEARQTSAGGEAEETRP